MARVWDSKAREKYKAAWRPGGFDDYRLLYPGTPPLTAFARADVTGAFAESWNDAGARDGLAAASDVTFVFVRGLFGAWIPRHLAQPLEALRRAGAETRIARSSAAGTVEANAASIAHDIEVRTAPSRTLVFLCHSKGGLDTLLMLARFPHVRQRTRAVVLCQTPRGGCAVLESVVRHRHRQSLVGLNRRLQERLVRTTIAVCGARAACIQLTGGEIETVVQEVDGAARSVPLLSVASWSGEPSAWLDSQHARLSQIRPGCAHDGLFFTQDLIWPLGEQILLPRLDHSQPTVGGGALDHGRLWIALASLALSRTSR
ncbi:MAG: hypothetical protein ACXWCY_07665 [Burkholderiales bacterium]